MLAQPYLNFGGRCEEALTFYQQALRAQVTMLMRFKESPEPPPGHTSDPEKILHASFTIGDTPLMDSDGFCTGKGVFQSVALALTTPDIASAERAFTALSEGGRVDQPLAKTFFSARFGMVVDRFGLCWMVLVAPEASSKGVA